MSDNLRKLYAIYVPSKTNIGDAASTPVRYLDFVARNFRVQTISIGAPDEVRRIEEGSPVIIGGGGLLAGKPTWDESILAALQRSKRVFGWGVGLNRSLRAAAVSPAKLPAYLDQFCRVGIRDRLPGATWVPCASAMSGTFDVEYPITRKYGVFLHSDRMERIPQPIRAVMDEANSFSNFGGFKDLPRAIGFLGNSECVLTNSFHGMYWATLLKKPVVVFDAFSEKFYLSRWKPSFFEEHGDLPAALESASVYGSALDEAREANTAFSEAVCADLEVCPV